METSLCSSCSSCPKVVAKGKNVEIGEKGNLVKLKANEWNTLVEKIKNGELNKV